MHSRCSRNTSQIQALRSGQPGGLIQGGGTMSCKNRAKYRRWTRLDSLSSLHLPGNRSPGSHDRSGKAAPSIAPTTGLVRADTGGSAHPRRGPCMVPRCHLERVRTHTQTHTFHPDLHPLSLSAPTLGRFSVEFWAQLGLVKRALKSQTEEDSLRAQGQLLPIPGPQLSLYK